MARFIYNPFSMLAVTLAQARLHGRGKVRNSMPTPEKKCVNCKTPHTTGKPFCSAGCRHEYKDNGNQPRVS